MSLSGFDSFTFTHDGATRTVYRRGSGPGVVVMHEIPGITPQVAEFGRRVADAGFTAYLPHLFGTPGQAALGAVRARARWRAPASAASSACSAATSRARSPTGCARSAGTPTPSAAGRASARSACA